MWETKIASPRPPLFARKGEALPAPAVEAGMKLNPAASPFAKFRSAGDGEIPLNEEELVTAATLSSLITRQNPRVPVTAPKAFYTEEGRESGMPPVMARLETKPRFPLHRAVPRSAPASIAATISPLESKTVEDPAKSAIMAANAGKRHQLTVRLKQRDFQAFLKFAVKSRRTYQDILESAVRHYLNDTGADSANQPVIGAEHREPAIESQTVSRLISRIQPEKILRPPRTRQRKKTFACLGLGPFLVRPLDSN